jgi:hypothetical protein
LFDAEFCADYGNDGCSLIKCFSLTINLEFLSQGSDICREKIESTFGASYGSQYA